MKTAIYYVYINQVVAELAELTLQCTLCGVCAERAESENRSCLQNSVQCKKSLLIGPDSTLSVFRANQKASLIFDCFANF